MNAATLAYAADLLGTVAYESRSHITFDIGNCRKDTWTVHVHFVDDAVAKVVYRAKGAEDSWYEATGPAASKVLANFGIYGA